MRSTWIVVADSSRARILTAPTPTAKLTELEVFDHPESRAKARDLVEDGQTTTFASVGGARHGVGADTPPQHHEYQVFARKLVQRLEQARNENRFDKLVLIAAPGFLGELRNTMNGPLAKMVVQTVAKDLAQLGIDKIHAAIEPQSLGAL